MGEYIANLWALHSSMMIAFAALIASTVVYLAFKEAISFWLMDHAYTFPWIGKIARFSRKPPVHANEPGWLNVERTLCSDYIKYIRPLSEDRFNNNVTYLGKASDDGREPVPAWVMILLAVLLIAEGLGFSYLLATWMAREASEYLQTWMMVAIVLVICIVQMWIMHAAGHQLFRTSLLRRCYRKFREDRGSNFNSQTIKLNDDQSIDDGERDYVQCANRVSKLGERGSYAMVLLALVVIVMIASLSTWMRMSNLRHEQIDQATLTATTSGSGNPFSISALLPSGITGPQQAADQKAAVDKNSAVKSEGMAAFIMLAFVFVITQIVALSAGYKYGFAGSSSKIAYRETRGFAHYDSYWNWFSARIQLAEARLETLQQGLQDHGMKHLPLTKRFEDYQMEKGGSHEAWREPKKITVEDIDSVIEKLATIPDQEAKTAYLNSLSRELASAAFARLKMLKEQAQTMPWSEVL